MDRPLASTLTLALIPRNVEPLSTNRYGVIVVVGHQGTSLMVWLENGWTVWMDGVSSLGMYILVLDN